MSTQDLNREQKRQLRKLGTLDDEGRPVRQPRQAAKRSDEARTSPSQYLREVRGEMAKVAWPTWPEVRRYSVIVLATVVVFMIFVTVLDLGFNEFFSWLYET